MNDEEIERLANLLKKQGLAASYIDAKKLAQSITRVRKRDVDLSKKEQTPKQGLPKVDELEEVKEVEQRPEQEPEESAEVAPQTSRFDKPDYDITQETKSLKELMAEDAGKIYRETQEDVVLEKEEAEEEKKEEERKEEEEQEPEEEKAEQEEPEEGVETLDETNQAEPVLEEEALEETSEEQKAFDDI
jgi:hypothetical protein